MKIIVKEAPERENFKSLRWYVNEVGVCKYYYLVDSDDTLIFVMNPATGFTSTAGAGKSIDCINPRPREMSAGFEITLRNE